MSLGEVEDDTMSIRYVIFPKAYDELKFKIVKSKLYLVLGVIEKNNKNEDSLTILKIAEI
jgi:DNA polymerase III alpha subunit